MKLRILLASILTATALAQGYGPGDQVIFDHIGERQQGVILRADSSGYLIRWKGPFGENERYFTPDSVKGRVGAQPAPAPQPQPQVDNNPQPNGANNPEPQRDNPPGRGGGVMSQQEVLGFLKGRLGDNPWGPNRQLVLKEFAQEVKGRGVDFHLDLNSPFYQELAKMGATSEITFPINDNFGPPNKRDWLFGTWNTEVNAPAVYFEKGGDLWRRNAQGQKAGSVTINAGGTYSWTLSSGKLVQGSWRPASPEEMKYAGGEGLILKQGRGGFDWIVTKYRDRLPQNRSPNWITIAELSTRQEREFGNR